MSTVFVFFAAVLSCMDAASDSHSKLLAGFGAGCSFLTMVWSLVAWAQWAAWDYIIGLQFDQSPKGTPLWLNPSTNAMTAVQINMSLGPGFACQVAGWCLVFIAMLVHCAALPQGDDMPDQRVPTGLGSSTMPPPAAANPGDKIASV